MKHLILATLVVFTAMPALACEAVRVGDIEVEHAWSRTTIGADRPGVVYLSIRNTGNGDDALIGVRTPIAGMPMLHETVVTDDSLDFHDVAVWAIRAALEEAFEAGRASAAKR